MNAPQPLVTATLLTGHDNGRDWLARVSIKSFLDQTYPNKELLILNTGKFSYPEHPSIREIHLAHPPTLGALRNIAIERAQGELLINWDDDDWSHPLRIEQQVAAYRPGHIVLLRSQIRANLRTDVAVQVDWNHGISGTMLWPRDEHRFPLLNQGEDTLFVESFPGKRIVRRNEARLYVRTYHGHNICSEAHVMNPKGAVPVAPADQTYLNSNVLPLYQSRPAV